MVTGELVHYLADSAGLAVVSSTQIAYTSARAYADLDKLAADGTNSGHHGDASKATTAMGHAQSLIPRAWKRVFLDLFLTRGCLMNVQISYFALGAAVAR